MRVSINLLDIFFKADLVSQIPSESFHSEPSLMWHTAMQTIIGVPQFLCTSRKQHPNFIITMRDSVQTVTPIWVQLGVLDLN
jgi:hypothetical protein